MSDGVRVNAGCGATPTPGWVNLDNSLVVRLGQWRVAAALLMTIRPQTRAFVRAIRDRRVTYANVARRIPFPRNSVEVLYSSHMIEHLDQPEALRFLAEARRVLAPNGIIRLAVPDLARHVQSYTRNGDANALISALGLASQRPRGLWQRVRAATIGPRQHLWMYDGASISALLTAAGFSDAQVLPAGQTAIVDPGPLDLHEREDESVYVEARQLSEESSPRGR